ncbi:MAG: hypothetical protein ACK47B_28265 [Armatimonadota bacterium]
MRLLGIPTAPSRIVALALSAGAAAALGCGAAVLFTTPPRPVTPEADTAYTSTRSVTALATDASGLWIATRGGILYRSRAGEWRHFTRQNGLPSHEVRELRSAEGTFSALFPRHSATWKDGKWLASPRRATEAGRSPGETCVAEWQGRECVATVTGLRVKEGDTWREFPLPRSRGTHVSALLPRGEQLWAALFGDGIWAFDGAAWAPLDLKLPPEAREITAMLDDGATLWVGTRSEGVWSGVDGRWTQWLQPDEPIDHNVQALATYGGSLFTSTLESGLAAKTRYGWRRYGAGQIASDAPRQMVRFRASLYLRHGNGRLDRLEGESWSRDIGARLPRRQVSALAADGDRLYAAQWGGWSEYDGREWIHHLNLPELQGLPITCLLPAGETLWVGTQGRGLAEVHRPSGTVRWHDERHGLPDDWVTVLGRTGQTICAGTFVGGLAWKSGDRWTVTPELEGENVTDLAEDRPDGLFIATRSGLWRRTADDRVERLNDRIPYLDTETQALHRVGSGLWVGTRTGLFFLTEATLREPKQTARLPERRR